MADSDISIDAQVRCVQRELALRGNVYKKRIAAGKMDRQDAVKEYRTMQAVVESLKSISFQKTRWLELIDRSSLVLTKCARCGSEVIILPDETAKCLSCRDATGK